MKKARRKHRQQEDGDDREDDEAPERSNPDGKHEAYTGEDNPEA